MHSHMRKKSPRFSVRGCITVEGEPPATSLLPPNSHMGGGQVPAGSQLVGRVIWMPAWCPGEVTAHREAPCKGGLEVRGAPCGRCAVAAHCWECTPLVAGPASPGAALLPLPVQNPDGYYLVLS